MTARHVIFGTGPVGLATMAALTRRGESVLMVNRSGSARVPDGVEVVAGDATDPRFTTRVAAGASVVYQTLNPEYHRWADDFPPLQHGVMAAAESSGARFVNMDNVYAYGRPHGTPLTEQTTLDPHTRKGRIRRAMAEELWAAHQAGRIQVTSGRASDYYGPGGGAASPLGDQVFPAALRGARASVFGNPDFLHSYTFIPDIGEGLAILGEHPDAVGSSWHLANDPQPQTTRAMVSTVFELAGTRPRLAAIPKIALRVLGLVDATVRELVEMSYEFEADFIVDSSRIRSLGAVATPIDEALAMTLASYR